MKLALGTAQLGLDYGISNKSGIPSDLEIKKIFQVAIESKIEKIDTAVSYGNSEKKIGNFSNNRFKVITKLPQFPNEKKYTYKAISEIIDTSINNLKIENLYGLLLHRPLELINDRGDNLYSILQTLKNEKKIQNIGISISDTSELDLLLKNFDFDIVQAPLNIFDRRLITSGWLSRLSNRGIEVHSRSTFLQGLLLIPSINRNMKFIKWNTLFNEYDCWLKETGYTPLEACLKFALSFPEINNVIIGVDNAAQLKQIIESSEGQFLNIPDSISSIDVKLINPISWLDF